MNREWFMRRCEWADRAVDKALRWRAETRADKERVEAAVEEMTARGVVPTDYVRRQLADVRLQHESAVALVDRETLKQSEAWFNLEDFDGRATAAAGLPQPTHVIEGQSIGRN